MSRPVPADSSEWNNLTGRNPDVVGRMGRRLLARRKTLPEGPNDATAGKNDYPWPKPKELR